MACSCSHRNIPPLFSVYARMEDLNEDSLYFFLKSGLLSRVNFTQKLNSAHAAESTEERQVCKDRTEYIFKICSTVLKLLPRFWSQVSPGLIAQVTQPWAYQADFEMFNYSVAHYLHTIGYSRPDMQNSQLSTLMFL